MKVRIIEEKLNWWMILTSQLMVPFILENRSQELCKLCKKVGMRDFLDDGAVSKSSKFGNIPS